MTREQVSALISACEYPHIRLFCILAATTGARMGDLHEAALRSIASRYGKIKTLQDVVAGPP